MNNYFYSFETPFGTLFICEKEGYITKISSYEDIRDHARVKTPLIAKAITQLTEYFARERTAFDLPLQVEGTAFQKNVWNKLLDIPYGETITYKQLAGKIGNENACRAVGGANNKNPIMIVIPCHRVIGIGGALTGYAGGMEMKKFLLDLEKRR